MAKFLHKIRNTGEFNGQNRGDISKTIKTLRGLKKRNPKQTRKLRAANFAIRAKRGEFSGGR